MFDMDLKIIIIMQFKEQSEIHFCPSQNTNIFII